ncbi:hypothetical protein FSS13T_16420 [Flavobacterium saliperosum S13]|uniref:Uncharacterized protein n=2 Tax=Flavobacterium saliperosum TaxID=329186 RepID=A0A1G4VHM2_9FLAO|nr:hypothetical protein [Flavobacterium saliperosum]ESU25409.1 hypothetical protein FSS13T_16420 [Flavobacterium saliperosum S13]SCX06921.1 hypothetical protein SAMN02927925_01082 [Flavobacterium saliperosum]
MKKIILLITLALCTSIGYSQKKKSTSKAGTVLTKTDNLSAEIVKNEFHLYVDEGGKKEVLFTRPIDSKRKLSECKITGFKAKETPLYYISWTEKGTTKTDLKAEDATSVVSEIWEVPTKTQVIANTQTTTHIVEKVFLDKLKNASETQERNRREGSEFKLLPNGDILLKNKSQESKQTYDPVTKKYIAAGAPAKKKKK